jgi:hypothetical protein
MQFSVPPVHTATLSPSIANPTISNTPGNDAGVEDDDEWGDMISTPFSAAPPVISSLEARHYPLGNVAEITSPISPQEVPTTESGFALGIISRPIMMSPSKETPTNSLSHKADTISYIASDADGWATADFSFFDTPASSSRIQQQTLPSSGSIAPAPQAPPAHTIRDSTEEMDYDTIVKSIVQNLPDLSYMLRR